MFLFLNLNKNMLRNTFSIRWEQRHLRWLSLDCFIHQFKWCCLCLSLCVPASPAYASKSRAVLWELGPRVAGAQGQRHQRHRQEEQPRENQPVDSGFLMIMKTMVAWTTWCASQLMSVATWLPPTLSHKPPWGWETTSDYARTSEEISRYGVGQELSVSLEWVRVTHESSVHSAESSSAACTSLQNCL